MKKLSTILLIFAALIFSAACAKTQNKWERDGGVFGSYTGDWVVINYSGGRIMDVWKMENVIVQSEEHSDGWLFKDANGNIVNIGGDAKAIKFVNKSGTDWNKYREYHAEFETQTYEQKFGQPIQSPK